MKRFWTAVLVSTATLSACTAGDPAQRPAPQAERPHLALAYRGQEGPTDKKIARAIGELRTEPNDVARLLDLSILLMRRRRETSKPVIMLYAKDAIDTALRIEPGNLKGQLLRGMIQQYEHDFEAAKRTAQAVLKDEPRESTAYLLLGDATLELGEYETALAAYQSAMDLRPDLRTYNRAAHVTWLHGDVDTSIRLLDMALDAGSVRDPESSAWCYVDLGTIHLRAGRLDLSMNVARRALGLVPNYVPALVLKARALAARGATAEAIETYEAALAHLPTVGTLLAQAELLDRTGAKTRAKQRLHEAEALGHEDPRPLAHYYARRGHRPQDALRLAEQALKERRDIFAWDTYGLALLRVGRLEEAEAALRRAMGLNTPMADFTLHRALLAAARGTDRRSVERLISKAKALNPVVDPLLVEELQVYLDRL